MDTETTRRARAAFKANLLHAARTAAPIGTLVLAMSASFGTTGALTACGESASCKRLRDDTFAQRTTWETCDPLDPDPCIKVFGNPKDCTGVLSCDFAVNPQHRTEAEKAVLTIGQESQGCYLCATPNCPTGGYALCDPGSRRCALYDQVTGEGGVGDIVFLDAGGTDSLDVNTMPGDASGASDDGAPE
jgi:hypothetical protein